MPNSASYITHSLMKDGLPSENSEVVINFVFGSKVKSKSILLYVFTNLLTFVFMIGVFGFERDYYCVTESTTPLTVNVLRSGTGTPASTISK